jgi:hypothetical protein
LKLRLTLDGTAVRLVWLFGFSLGWVVWRWASCEDFICAVGSFGAICFAAFEGFIDSGFSFSLIERLVFAHRMGDRMSTFRFDR